MGRGKSVKSADPKGGKKAVSKLKLTTQQRPRTSERQRLRNINRVNKQPRAAANSPKKRGRASKSTTKPATPPLPVLNHSYYTRSRKLQPRSPSPQAVSCQDKPKIKIDSHLLRSSAHLLTDRSDFLLPSIEVTDNFSSSAESESESESESDSSSSEIPREFGLLELGIIFAISDYESALIKLALRYPELCSRMVDSPKNMAFHLRSRNVNVTKSKEKDSFDFKNLTSILNVQPQRCHSSYQNDLWNFDVNVCHVENEAIFQRTLMMSMIDRRRLFAARQNGAANYFTFSAEKRWNCPPMPSRCLVDTSPELSKVPQPDLCVSFKTEEVLTEACLGSLSPPMLRMINVEGTSNVHQQRAFPFLIVEVKKGETTHFYTEALNQCLNAASQALHNMHEFFREAEMTATFFSKVRFFTAAAASSGCIFRMHRAVPLGTEEEKRKIGDYSLKFEFEEIDNFQGNQYTRQAIVDQFEKIIWGYGPILREELRKVCSQIENSIDSEKRRKELRGREEKHYRYGQTFTRKDSKTPVPNRNPQKSRQSIGASSTRSDSIISDNATPLRRMSSHNSLARNAMHANGSRQVSESSYESVSVTAEQDDGVILSFQNDQNDHEVADVGSSSTSRGATRSRTDQHDSPRRPKRRRQSQIATDT